MAKDNRKCLRLSDEAVEIIEKCLGDNFSEKFESLVYQYNKMIPEREKRLRDLEKEIKQCEKRLSAFRQSISQVERYDKQLRYFLDIVDQMIT